MPNKKDEIENRFTAARHVMDDLCRAYYGMTWDEHERLHGGRGGSGGYLPLFTACLQMAAELAGKEFDPANYTERSCGSSVSCTPPPGCPYRILRSGICKKEESECQN